MEANVLLSYPASSIRGKPTGKAPIPGYLALAGYIILTRHNGLVCEGAAQGGLL
jgi:hypothetical protein